MIHPSHEATDAIDQGASHGGHAHGHHDHAHHDHDHPAHADHHAAVFSAPDHDHAPCAAATLSRAERVCGERGIRLTPIRRQVLEALAATHAPIGAYEMIERLSDRDGKRHAPITVYRALEFLLENGLAHRIESRNAFIACPHDHRGGDVVIFLICEACGSVGEAVSDEVRSALAGTAQAAGFTPRAQVIEIAGTCRHCRAQQAA